VKEGRLLVDLATHWKSSWVWPSLAPTKSTDNQEFFSSLLAP
jgi:hypothetical protein